MTTDVPMTYGELVVLGYSSYKRLDARSTGDKGHWLPVGAPNSHFRLTKRPAPNALLPRRTVLVESLLQNREFTRGLQQALATDKATRFVCVPVSATSTVATEYVQSPSSPADVFQLGRQPSQHNDFVVPGHLHGEKGTISRFAARIVCDRTPPYTCRVFAGGFDCDHQVTVPLNAPTFCQGCQRWSFSSATCHAKCAASTASSDFVAGSSKDNKLTVRGFSSTSSGSMPPVDALTRNGVRLWRPENQSWFEVSVHGRIYAVSTSSPSRTSTVFVRPTGPPVASEAVLTHGSILDVGGVHIKFLLPSSTSPAALGSLALQLGSLQVHCPVQLHPLQFGPHPTPAKPHDNDAAPKEVPIELQPHVYPACGHVCGYNARMASTKLCPLCRTPSALVPLRFATLNGQRLLTSESDLDQGGSVPDCVFNPCGHMVGAALAAESAALRLPSSGKSICPFCAKTLDSTRPFSKLFFYHDEDDDAAFDAVVGAA